MLKSFFRNINLVKMVNPSSIKIYHHSSSAVSVNLLNKLTSYGNMPCTLEKFLDVFQSGNWLKQNKTSSNNKFFVDVNINKPLSYGDYMFIMENCIDMHPDNKAILEKYLKLNKSYSFEPLGLESFEKLTSNATDPLIIDFKNNLIANDDKSFDRIMSNYLSCGKQNASNINTRPQKKTSDNINEVVHPHIAEFADLY